MKKSIIWSLIAVLVMGVVFTGCGNNASQKTTSKQETEPKQKTKIKLNAGEIFEGEGYSITIKNPEKPVFIALDQPDVHGDICYLQVPITISASKDVEFSANYFGMDYEENKEMYEKLQNCFPKKKVLKAEETFEGLLYYEWGAIDGRREGDFEKAAEYPKSVKYTQDNVEVKWKFNYDCTTPIEVDEKTILTVLPRQKIRFTGNHKFGGGENTVSFALGNLSVSAEYDDIEIEESLYENTNNGHGVNIVEGRILSLLAYYSGAESSGQEKHVFIDHISATVVN